MSKTKTRILIVGDVMLDRYEYGKVRRISPEAPVPVLLHTQVKTMLGGAGNVAVNARALGAEPVLFSIVGRDSAGDEIDQLLKAENIGSRLFSSSHAPTIVKTRFIAGTNHILRVDCEADSPEPFKPTANFKQSLKAAIRQTNAIIISDYGKGFASREVCRAVLSLASRHGKSVLVDPKTTNYSKYAGATLVKPNLKEFSEATGKRFDPTAGNFICEATSAGRALCKKHHLGSILITLSEHGMLFVSGEARHQPILLPTKAREVFDVSGAGDTTLSALAVALADGKDVEEAMRFANAAAGIVVAKLGTATATRDEITRTSEADSHSAKILTRDHLKEALTRLRREGKRIGFTNGCFDCCHLGHLASLQQARQLCDVLVVGVNSDTWIRRHKGADRPIQDEATRTSLLAALACVDYVTVFSEETALPLVKAIKPDIIAKEGYSLDKWPEGRYVNSRGGKAIVLKRVDGYSTTALAQKMKRLSGRDLGRRQDTCRHTE